jgi:ADP-ribose pyrophosphatase
MTRKPRVLSKRPVFESPWVTLFEKSVDLGGPSPEAYYSLRVKDYLAIFAVTPGGRAVIVRQYRPAVEKFTYEIPAGLVENDESPESGCRRELLEETGFEAESVELLGVFDPDTGRYEHEQHCFFVRTKANDPVRPPEAGMSVELWTKEELSAAMKDGRFRHLLHVGAVLLADDRW